jgi:hypothetical protein
VGDERLQGVFISHVSLSTWKANEKERKKGKGFCCCIGRCEEKLACICIATKKGKASADVQKRIDRITLGQFVGGSCRRIGHT